MINGIINIYKEAGFTSHDVVAKLRGIVHQKKIGHTGTLDPDAVGVLPVCFGNATKLCDMLTDKSKEYEACMRLGVTTDTQDMSGKILTTSKVNVTEDEVIKAVMGFVGGYEQIPPMYSAIKVNGKKLYELARAGKEVERQPRHVDIPSIRITDVGMPLVSFVVECSKGTYIRALCADIGEKLGCGAAMESLKRTRVGNFRIEDAITISRFEEIMASGEFERYADKIVMPPDSIFMDYGKACIKGEYLGALLNGNKLNTQQLDFENLQKFDSTQNEFKDGEFIRVYDDCGEFKAVYTFMQAEKCFKPYKMFL
jgi:tRNA pseudouridine55 synthase